MPTIKQLTDKLGNLIYPITKEAAVFDENGVDLETKLRNLGPGASYEVDSALSGSSTNPVENRVITNALSGKQDVINDLNAIRSGASSGASAYQKPIGGIPAGDLAAFVQEALALANSALQSFTETDPTVPSWAKQTNKPSYTAQEIGALPNNTFIPTNLSDLSNVDITVPSNGQALMWDSTANKWKPGTIQGGTGNITSESISGEVSLLIDPSNYYTKAESDARYGGGGTITIDSALSSSSENAVRNSVITEALNNKVDKEQGKGLSENNYTDYDKGIVTATPVAITGIQQSLESKYEKPSSGIPASDLASGVIPVVPTALSSFTDDLGSSPTHTHSQYLTAQDISGKQDKSTITSSADATGSITLANNTEFRFTNAALTSLTIALPESLGDRLDTWISFNSGSTATSATYPNTIKWSGDNVSNNVFVPAASKTYNIGIWYDGINVNAVARGV